MIKVDFHNHLKTTSKSDDSIFNKVINIARNKLGPNGCIIGIANSGGGPNQEYDFRYENFSQLKGYDRYNLKNSIYIPEKKVLVIKTQEIEFPEGHILVLGLQKNKNIQRKTIEDAVKEANDLGAPIIVDHPLFYEGLGPYLEKNLKLLEKLDGIEVHNGEACLPIPGYLNANKKAQEFYNKIKYDYDIGAISSSDGHSLYELGSSYTLLNFQKIKNSEDLKKILKESIKEHKDFSQDKQHNSYIGAFDHAGKMATIMALSKFKIKI